MAGSYCGPMGKSDDDYRAESDHRTMMDAAEVQQDPKRMAGVKKHHKKTMKKAALVQRTMMSGGGR